MIRWIETISRTDIVEFVVLTIWKNIKYRLKKV